MGDFGGSVLQADSREETVVLVLMDRVLLVNKRGFGH